MLRNHYLFAMIAALSITHGAFAADEGEAMFTKNKCITCHKLDNKTIGPGVKEIAAKYAGNVEAQTKLEEKVRTGGGGVWGKIPMPTSPAAVSDGDIKVMVTWVLSHK